MGSCPNHGAQAPRAENTQGAYGAQAPTAHKDKKIHNYTNYLIKSHTSGWSSSSQIISYNLTHQAGLHRRKTRQSHMHRICAMLPPCCPHCGSCQSHCGRFRAAFVRGRCAPVLRHCCRSILRTVCTALELLPAMERGDQEVFLRLPSGVAVGTVDLPSVVKSSSSRLGSKVFTASMNSMMSTSLPSGA